MSGYAQLVADTRKALISEGAQTSARFNVTSCGKKGLHR